MRLDFNIGVRGLRSSLPFVPVADLVSDFIVFSSRSAPLILPEFPAIFEADVRDPPLRPVASFCRQASAVGSFHLFARYFVSQLCDAFFDRILHDDRRAPHTGRITVKELASGPTNAAMRVKLASLAATPCPVRRWPCEN
jgi:hypothetical protein